MWVKQCHKPAMTGNGNHTTYLFMVMTAGWFMKLFYPHYIYNTHLDGVIKCSQQTCNWGTLPVEMSSGI